MPVHTQMKHLDKPPPPIEPCPCCDMTGYFFAELWNCEYCVCPVCDIESKADWYTSDLKVHHVMDYFCPCGVLCCVAKGLIHADNGCSEKVYIAEFITKYELDGVQFSGMPIFDSLEDLAKHDPVFTVLETEPADKRPVEDRCCPHTAYPYKKTRNTGIYTVSPSRIQSDIALYSISLLTSFISFKQ